MKNKRTFTKEEFIVKSNAIYGDKYDYSKVNYINNKTKVCIICFEHGEFWKTPYKHLIGQGCPECSKFTKKKKLTSNKDIFIKKAKKLYGNKYSYEKVEYVNSKTKVKIICPKHGEFLITPNNFLRDHECPKCKGEKISLSKQYDIDKFIEKAKQKHSDKYNYSKVNYINSQIKVCIICCKHGEFWQKPSEHLQGYGCPICGGTKKITLEQFIERAKEKHGKRYDYSNVNYINYKTKVEIECKVCGNKFWQTPHDHLNGKGCPKCKQSHMENHAEKILEINHILYESQKKFFWLGLQSLDFYLPKHSIAIECQGQQHFELTRFTKRDEKDYAEKMLQTIKKRDLRKFNLCNDNNIKLYYYIPKDSGKYINNKQYNSIYTKDNVITDMENFVKKLE